MTMRLRTCSGGWELFWRLGAVLEAVDGGE
jgi:hypothetical protein